MRVHLTGHSSFQNRGCEAIVRSTVVLLREQFGDLRVLVPSTDQDWDSGQWPEARAMGVEFCRAYSPLLNRAWVHFQRLPLPTLAAGPWPFGLPDDVSRALAGSDLVMSVGGDNYSLDYRRPSLLMGTDGYAMDHAVPVVLWGASVGPFEGDPALVPVMRDHLARMSRILVREDLSLGYLQSLGLGNVQRMVDPAFTLESEPYDSSDWPDEGDGVVGVNMSALVLRYAGRGRSDVLESFALLCEHIVRDHGLSVALVSHVMPRDLSGPGDHTVGQALLQRLSHLGKRVAQVDATANAAQLKGAISRCRFFVGARTHATIAALSTGVPTISIGYSIKASGINADVLGSSRWVIDHREVTGQRLLAAFDELVSAERHARGELEAARPRLLREARSAAASLVGIATPA